MMSDVIANHDLMVSDFTGDIVKYVFENAIHKYLKIQNPCTNVHMFSEY
jgi:hypothetical protein